MSGAVWLKTCSTTRKAYTSTPAGMVAASTATGGSPISAGASITPWMVGEFVTVTGCPVPVPGVRSRVGSPASSVSVK